MAGDMLIYNIISVVLFLLACAGVYYTYGLVVRIIKKLRAGGKG
ncbi:unnamed protein product [marine sediment metagenome]|uniref:Uncharacterized protein n=1 Tax=marine sediment metagenome TaxID=412755 RepID=X1BLD1_9ZZZZ